MKSSNHSILILTRNRPQWIEYSLNFYSIYNYGGTILIADDSTDQLFKKNSEIIDRFKEKLNIRHIKGAGRNLLTRVKRYCLTRYHAVQDIDTEYYSQTGDDDILYTPEIFKALNFLNVNKDYNYVQGSTIQVELDNEMNIASSLDTWWPECKYDDPLDRVTHYAHTPGLPLLGVNRSKTLKDLIQVEQKIGWPPFARKNNEGLEFFDEELSWSMQIYASGKIGRIKDCLLYFRLKTPVTENEDRIENLSFHNDLNSNYVIGPISSVYKNHLSDCVKETHEELMSFLELYNTKYSKEICNYQISQCLWSLIRRYNGAGLFKTDTYIAKELNQILNTKKTVTYKGFKLRKVLTFLKNLKFYLNLKNISSDFENTHLKLKKIIL